MKWGHHIPRDKRPAMAARALEIFARAKSMNAAVLEIGAEFDVSHPTARNLVSYGRFLTSPQNVKQEV